MAYGEIKNYYEDLKDLSTIRRRRYTEVTIETEEAVSISNGVINFRWCPECRKQVPMIRAEAAARLAGVELEIIERWGKTNSVHTSAETENVICLVSLGKLL